MTRSNSTTSSLALTTCENSTTNFSRPQPSAHSPLRPDAPSAPASPTHIPAFRFIAPDTSSPISPVSPVSPSFTNTSHPSAPPSRFPSPSHSATTNEPEPKFCAYYIPRYLFMSKYPCVECYGKAEWEGLRWAWMENYRLGHPLDKAEGVEVLSGVLGVREKYEGLDGGDQLVGGL